MESGESTAYFSDGMTELNGDFIFVKFLGKNKYHNYIYTIQILLDFQKFQKSPECLAYYV